MPTTIPAPIRPRDDGWRGTLARAFDLWARYHAEMVSYHRGRL